MTIVQKYYEEENKTLTHSEDDIQEWNEISQRLGLGNQEEQVGTSSAPIPFMPLKQKMLNVIKELCPKEESYKKYSNSTIPIEVLRIIDLCEREKYFQNISIFYDWEDPDPFLVGEKGYWYEYDFYESSNKELKGKKFTTEKECIDAGANNPGFSSNGRYLLAKWGDVQMSLEDLVEKARNLFMKKSRADIENKISDLQNDLVKLENESTLKFGV